MGLFSEIPGHNQVDVLKKLDYTDFARFKQCSQESMQITKNFRCRFPVKVSEFLFHEGYIIVRTDALNQFTMDRILEEEIRFETRKLLVFTKNSQGIPLEEYCKSNQLAAKGLYVAWQNIEPSTLNNLVGLKEIEFANSELEESDFLLLDQPKISVIRGDLSLSTVNAFLKQWIEGKRRIEKLCVQPIQDDYLGIFNDLEFSAHETFGVPNVMHSYSLGRWDGKKLFISIYTFSRWTAEIGMQASESDDEDVERWLSSFVIPLP